MTRLTLAPEQQLRPELAGPPLADHPRRILVIGGTQFIGRLLVEELVKAGHEVSVLHRKPRHTFGNGFRTCRETGMTQQPFGPQWAKAGSMRFTISPMTGSGAQPERKLRRWLRFSTAV